MSSSKYMAYQQASLSQKVSFSTEILKHLVGTDKDISDSIAILIYVTNEEAQKTQKTNPIRWLIGLLDVLRLSHFATSEKTDILTKLGFFLPKAEDEISKF